MATDRSAEATAVRRHHPMPLFALMDRALGDECRLADIPAVRIHDICCDSRQAAPGTVFVAVSGAVADGAAFAADAVRRGAVAIVADRDIEVPENIPLVRVANAREAVSRLASEFYGVHGIQTRGELDMIGVTGTNGKTTVAYMTRSLLRAAGRTTAILGTIEYDLIDRKITANLTTPDPVSLIRCLAEAHAAGARGAVMEVSSHSLDQSRTAGLRFSTAIFTNLTQDHLDYHGTIDDYLLAKRRLFDALEPDATAVINADEPSAQRMVERCRARVLRYGLRPDADVRADILAETRDECRFILRLDGDDAKVRLPMVGRHNIMNALAAASAGFAAGLDIAAVASGLENMSCVPGRLQSIEAPGRGFSVFVDYAHTDDALRHALRSLRPVTERRLVCVFGCGGDRDKTKRPLMARAVAEGADSFVVTSDNPRTEDPLAIIEDIKRGLTADDAQRGAIEPDRAKAIALAVERLAPGDTLLIAGKGHEDYQILGTTKIHFDDAEIAREAIERTQG